MLDRRIELIQQLLLLQTLQRRMLPFANGKEAFAIITDEEETDVFGEVADEDVQEAGGIKPR